jgi:magnesium-transporting ATPase (P-type)
MKPNDASQQLPVPYSRREVCSWQSEHAAEQLSSALIGSSAIHGSLLPASTSSTTHHNHLSHGWSKHHVSYLRRRYGDNRFQESSAEDGDDDGEEDGCIDTNSDIVDRNHRERSNKRYCTLHWPRWINPIFSTLVSQLKEPLIMMLLGSAAISLFIGNTADAVSIAFALLIVSLVAAVQEYRSEQALEKLNNLVPHTCTVLRDGNIHDGFLARFLVLGDLVLLSTGEYVQQKCFP